MLVNMNQLINDAEKHNYCVGMFTSPSLPFAEAVIAAAEEMNAPLMFGQVESWQQYGDIEINGPIMAEMARKAKVPVCLHLDHGTTLPYIMKAVKAGYSSVMADFSELSFEENVKWVKKVVEFCHAADITVEGLCGKMPNVWQLEANPDMDISEFFTKPEELKEFVERTKADAMTVSFGTVHNMKVSKPMLNFELLKRLKAASGCALVMHGSSGVEEGQIKQAINCGLRKINVYTKLAIAAQPAMQKAMAASDEPLFFHELLEEAQIAMKEAIKESITLFSNGYDFSKRTYQEFIG
ncbi:MAG: class II fructose-bisphosphate aldolase [Lachnospiraceae bacterium]